MIHPVLNPCKECESNEVSYPPVTDGMVTEWYCLDCGEWVGELLTCAEP